MPLTLQQMHQRIKSGKSVLYKNRIISSLDKLPSAAELAKTDEEKTAAADDLRAQMQKMQSQLDELQGGKIDSSSGENSENTEDSDESDVETFESLMKLRHEELFKKAEPIAKEKGIELDPKATKATLSKFILGEIEQAS